MTSNEQALLDATAMLRDKQTDLTRQLIAINTVNPYSGDSSAHIETEGQDWIADRLRELGAQVRTVPVPADVYERGLMIGPVGRDWTDRDNVIAEWTFGDASGPTIMLNNHMDTVGTEGMSINPFDPRIEDGKLFGRGSTDTKGNLLMGLIAVEAVLKHASELNGRIVFEVVVDEECNGAGAGTLACCLAGVTGDFAICLDGVKGELNNGCNGIATAKVNVFGMSGHSSQGESASALDKAVVVKQAIDAFGAQYAKQHADCRYNIGVFRCGTLPAIVPGEAEIQINFNYDIADAQAAEQAGEPFGGVLYRRRFEQAMAALGDADPWFKQKPVAVSWIKDMYPCACEGDDDFTRTTLQAVSDVQGSPATAGPMSAWFDAAHIVRHLHIPLLGVSAGTPGKPHSADEYVVLDDLHQGAQQVALALHRLLRARV
jgi:acetylornithine deacetylase